MKRRDFLQRSGFTLAALGAGDLALSPLVQRYQQVLAAPTQRKLALLVGINQYHSMPLYGCVTDVELQRELLVHRFGFQPSDILTLTDQQATREAIATAFVEHLIEQARSGDVVVFHFSGYGGMTLSTAPDTIQPSLVTVDVPSQQGDLWVVNDLLADTLLLLLRSLPTDRVTTVLDTSYIYPDKPLQGDLRLRSRPDAAPVQASDAELAFQASLLSQTNVDRVRLAAQRRSGQMPGVILAAADLEQWATEAKWDGFSAGLFTYALTQQLWQATPATALRITLRRATEQVQQLVNQTQQPQLSGQKSQERPLMPYHVPPLPDWGADGVVVRVEEGGKTAWVWLGGLAAALLEQYEPKALLILVAQAGTDVGHDRTATQLQILSRHGLLAKAKLHPGSEMTFALRVGQFVREQVRVLPRNLELTITLDSTLARIERVDAISAISTVPRVSAAIAGEQVADYLFSKTQDTQPTQVAALPTTALPDILNSNKAVSQSSYALFSPGRNAVPNTAGEGGEAVKAAIKRLIPKLQTLLATKLLNLTVNDGASQLAVRATLAVLTPQERGLMQRETSAIAQQTPLLQTLPPILSPEAAKVVSLPIGSHIQYQLENQSQRSLHFLLLHLDSSGDLILLRSPLALTVSEQPAVDGQNAIDRSLSIITSNETLTLPQTSASFQWLIGGPSGLATTYLLCSRAPFSQTIALLGMRSPDAPPLQPLAKPLEIAQAILQDLHNASDRAAQPSGNPTDSFVLDMNAWASLRFVYQVV